MQNILVIYDRLDGDLQYLLTQDEEFLEFNDAKINGMDTPDELQDRISQKLFNEAGDNLVEWQPLAQLTSNIIPLITKIVCIAFIP